MTPEGFTKQMVKKLLARFHAKYAIAESGCWLWTGGTDGSFGYGTFWLRGAKTKAHRAAYMLFVGDIPQGLCVLHKCDTPACVNPEHLFVGTKHDNAVDMLSKGRGGQYKNPPRGARRKDSKLTERAVLDIRSRCAGGESQGAVAKAYGIGQPTVHKIVHRQRWSHI